MSNMNARFLAEAIAFEKKWKDIGLKPVSTGVTAVLLESQRLANEQLIPEEPELKEPMNWHAEGF